MVFQSKIVSLVFVNKTQENQNNGIRLTNQMAVEGLNTFWVGCTNDTNRALNFGFVNLHVPREFRDICRQNPNRVTRLPDSIKTSMKSQLKSEKNRQVRHIKVERSGKKKEKCFFPSY